MKNNCGCSSCRPYTVGLSPYDNFHDTKYWNFWGGKTLLNNRKIPAPAPAPSPVRATVPLVNLASRSPSIYVTPIRKADVVDNRSAITKIPMEEIRRVKGIRPVGDVPVPVNVEPNLDQIKAQMFGMTPVEMRYRAGTLASDVVGSPVTKISAVLAIVVGIGLIAYMNKGK